MDQAPNAPAKPGPTPAEGSKRLVGTTVAGRYKVLSQLGEGGMGAVYLVEHALMRKRMALKVLNAELSQNREMVARFEREAMAAAHLDHPNVVAATDLGTTDEGSLFLILEFIDGKSLREHLAFGPLSAARVIHIARQITSALQRAHSVGIVHRDLKPENVMILNRDGDPDFVKVLDFGLAKVRIEALVEDVSHRSETLTKFGTIFGTPAYMAPEQAAGGEVDGRTDLYALGMVMYELLTGWVPFDGDDPSTILRQQILAAVPPMSQKAPSVKVPPALDAVVMKLLEKSPKDRYKDAKALLDALTEVAISEGLRYEPSTPLARLNIPNSGVAVLDNRPTLSGAGSAERNTPVQAAGSESVAQIEYESAANLAKSTPSTSAASSTSRPPESRPQGAEKKPEAEDHAVGHAATVPAMASSSHEIAKVQQPPTAAHAVAVAKKKGAEALALAAQKWAALLAYVRSRLPEKHRNVSSWALGSGVAAALLLPLFFVFGLLWGGDEDGETPAVGMVGYATDEEMKKAVEKGPMALLKLRNQYPNDSRTHRALVKGYGQTGDFAAALQAVGPLLAVDPAAADDPKILQYVVDAALQPQTSEAAMLLLEQRLGESGVDTLIDLAERTTMEPYRSRFRSALEKETVQQLASPDGKTVIKLRSATKCEAKRGLLAEAAKQGGLRTLEELKKLQSQKGCGPGNQADCWGCLRQNKTLHNTTVEVQKRLGVGP